MRLMSEFMPTCRANFGDLLQESRFYTVWTQSGRLKSRGALTEANGARLSDRATT